ncbi:AMP deaminase 2 [Nymphon striatum]|nr:AMP deaminase 2 [Nymphon striatum]
MLYICNLNQLHSLILTLLQLRGYSEITLCRRGSESPVYSTSKLSKHHSLQFQDTIMSNEISAPYEVPQFPIEEIERKLALQRQFSNRIHKEYEDRKSHGEPSVPSIADDDEGEFPIEENDFVPHFQRVSISGEEASGVPLEDLQHASKKLVEAMAIREKYMHMCNQSFPSVTSRFLRTIDKSNLIDSFEHEDMKTIQDLVRKVDVRIIYGAGRDLGGSHLLSYELSGDDD